MKIRDLIEGSGEVGLGDSISVSDFYRGVKAFAYEIDYDGGKVEFLGKDDKMQYYLSSNKYWRRIIGIDLSVNVEDPEFSWHDLYKHPEKKKFLSKKPRDIKWNEHDLLKVYFLGTLDNVNKKIRKFIGETTYLFNMPRTNPAFQRQGVATRAYGMVLNNAAIISDSDQSKEARLMWYNIVANQTIPGARCYSFEYGRGFLNRLIDIEMEDITGNGERYKELALKDNQFFVLSKKEIKA